MNQVIIIEGWILLSSNLVAVKSFFPAVVNMPWLQSARIHPTTTTACYIDLELSFGTKLPTTFQQSIIFL